MPRARKPKAEPDPNKPKRVRKPKAPPKCKACKGEGKLLKYSLREKFNPHSSDQVATLIRSLGLKMPIKRGSEGKETTEQKYLKRFGKRHPVFNRILECREKQKMTSTYIWVPNRPEGRVGTEYGFHPSTWRKSSRNYNLMTFPIRKPEMADAIRGTIIAAPGHVLVEADYSSIEGVLVGVCAGDPTYVRICKAGLHGFTASHQLGQGIDPNLPFDELRKACKAVKKANPQAYDIAKRGGHGANYGLTAYGLNDEFQETFPTQKKAQEFLDFYFGLYPSLRKWHHSVLELASRQTYLDNHFGMRHYFYNVFSYKNGQWTLGEDAKRAIAFTPQSDASAIQNIDLLELASDPLILPLLRLVIHDSKVLEVPEEMLDYVCQRLWEVMTRERKELGGVSIGTEISYGKTMKKADMTEWEGPKVKKLETTKPPDVSSDTKQLSGMSATVPELAPIPSSN